MAFAGPSFSQMPNHANQVPYNYDPQCASQDVAYGKGGRNSFTMRKRRLNLVAIVISLFVPWVLYCGLSALSGFGAHYRSPLLVTVSTCIGFGLVIWMGLVAFASMKDRSAGDAGAQPSWYCFLFITSLLAWTLAVLGGRYNFEEHTRSYYDIMNLNVYDNVDPSGMRGAQVMDGGRVTFEVGSTLDIKRSIGFKNDRTYCVAPITIRDLPLASYDFWAVGTDCCTGDATADFKCGEFDNRKAHAGLRVMRDDYRPFFRLAVQQAEAKHQIKATHPLFFKWVEDPEASLEGYRLAGYKFFFSGMIGHFVLQLCLVMIAAVSFAKGGI